jgi:L-amino acid N-acyltransferase YncA
MEAITCYLASSETLNVNDFAALLSDLDDSLPDPINQRNFFSGYKDLAIRFMENAEVIIARDETGDLAGCAVIYIDPERYSHGYEAYIGVRESFKRRGVGRKLTEYEFKLCREKGMSRMMTNCNPNNTAKINLNLSLGYKQVTDDKKIADYLALNEKWSGKIFFIIDL